MAAVSVVRYLRNLLDVAISSFVSGKVLGWDSTLGKFRLYYPAGWKGATLVVAGGYPTTTLGGAGFQTIVCQGDIILYDPSNNYNTATSIYTVPLTGLYQIDANVRLDDDASFCSFGHGVHTSNADGPWFAWYETNQAPGTGRNGAIYRRVAFFNAGDQLRHYGYGDYSNGIGDRSMTIVFLAEA